MTQIGMRIAHLFVTLFLWVAKIPQIGDVGMLVMFGKLWRKPPPHVIISIPFSPVSTSSPSIRDIARILGISHTTVSQALRNKCNVKLATRKRVQAAADSLGYQINPLAGSVMAQMRLKRGAAFCATLAIIDLDGTEGRPPASAEYHQELFEGASDRAVELGFRPEIIRTDNGDTVGRNINSILQERGIHGALLLPVRKFQTVTRQDWSRCACVYADYVEGQTALHNICPDHFGAMRAAIRHLGALGYRRPGLVLEQSEERRLFGRWGSAFSLFATGKGRHDKASKLITSGNAHREFSTWFKSYRPDVVIGHGAEIMDWMRECGASIPSTHGFCCLNIVKNPDLACTGLDQQPRMIGARGIEMVIAQLQRGEYGVPSQPLSTAMPSVWSEGPTLRPSSLVEYSSKSTQANLVAA